MSSVTWGMLYSFLPDFLAADAGLGVTVATLVALTFGAGSFFGVVFGSVVGQRLYNHRRTRRLTALMAGLGTALSTVPLYVTFQFAGRMSIVLIVFMALIGGFFGGIGIPIGRALVVNVVTPNERGMATGLLTTVDAVGKAIGPITVSGLIAALGKLPAFNLCLALFFPTALFLCAIAVFIQRDVDKQAQKVLREAERALRGGQSPRGDTERLSSDDEKGTAPRESVDGKGTVAVVGDSPRTIEAGDVEEGERPGQRPGDPAEGGAQGGDDPPLDRG